MSFQSCTPPQRRIRSMSGVSVAVVEHVITEGAVPSIGRRGQRFDEQTKLDGFVSDPNEAMGMSKRMAIAPHCSKRPHLVSWHDVDEEVVRVRLRNGGRDIVPLQRPSLILRCKGVGSHGHLKRPAQASRRRSQASVSWTHGTTYNKEGRRGSTPC